MTATIAQLQRLKVAFEPRAGVFLVPHETGWGPVRPWEL